MQAVYTTVLHYASCSFVLLPTTNQTDKCVLFRNIVTHLYLIIFILYFLSIYNVYLLHKYYIEL